MTPMREGDVLKYRVDPSVERIWRRFRRALRGCADSTVEEWVLGRLSAAGGTGMLLTGTVEADGSCSIQYRLLAELALLEISDLARNASLTAVARRERVHAAMLCMGLPPSST